MFESYPDVLTKEQVAELLQCKPSSVYELSRSRSQARQEFPIPVMKLPFGLRFRKSEIIEWLDKVASTQKENYA